MVLLLPLAGDTLGGATTLATNSTESLLYGDLSLPKISESVGTVCICCRVRNWNPLPMMLKPSEYNIYPVIAKNGMIPVFFI
jgi:hypothetical protein